MDEPAKDPPGVGYLYAVKPWHPSGAVGTVMSQKADCVDKIEQMRSDEAAGLEEHVMRVVERAGLSRDCTPHHGLVALQTYVFLLRRDVARLKGEALTMIHTTATVKGKAP